jgi:hypothetical protein
VSARLQAAMIALVTACVLYLVGASVVDRVVAERAQEQAHHATVEKEATEQAAKSLAEQVIEACKTPPVDPVLAPACRAAQQVQRTTPPQLPEQRNGSRCVKPEEEGGG